MAKNDEMIKALMAKVVSQKESLGSKPRVSWKTNGIFKYDGVTHINLNATSDIEKLVEALSFLLTKAGMLESACKILSVPTIEFAWYGHSVADWTEDFKTRISVIKWESKKSQLDATQAKLSTLVSEEARTEMELESISKMLG